MSASSVLITFTLCLFFFSCTCQTDGEKSDRNALVEIEMLHEKDMAASKVFDVETLISLSTDDVVLLQPNEPPIRGREALRLYLESNRQAVAEYEILEYVHDFEEISVLGDWAYEWGEFRGSYRTISNGEVVTERMRLFRILRRQPDDSWKVARAIWHALPDQDG